MLRQNVVGRKNWLFARSEGGAQVAATAYTLIQSCMLQGIDPHTYLVDVLGRLQDHPANRVGELTPLNWRLARENHPTQTG
jgi:transposase